MSKTLVAGLQAHLDTKSTTMALCWKVVRRDGLVQGFTEHDENVVFDGVTYLASSGFTSSRMEQNLGMAPSNLNIDGALSSATINEDDLAKGLYDDADVSLFWVNWNNVGQRVTLEIGNIGEIIRRETFFSAEFRSLVHRLNQKTGRIYQRSCDAILGDARCGVDLTSPSYKGTGAITSAAGRDLIVSGIGTFADKFFSYGILTFTSGLNNGLAFEVKTHIGTAIVLWDIPSETVAPADGFTITAGCPKDAETCRTKFNNIVNFRGFPFIPGNDILPAYPRQEDEKLDGGSYFR